MGLDPHIAHSNLPGHHPDCDGFRMHSVEAVQTIYGTWVPSCPNCGLIPVVGSFGSPQTAVKVGAHHNGFEECDSRCLSWD